MAEKIAAKKQLALKRGYTSERWNQKNFKRSYKPYAPASERQLKPRSELFCSWVEEEKYGDPDTMFSSGAELPSTDLIKNFLNFYASTGEGRIFDKPTIDTVTNYCNCVTGFLKRKIGKKYSKEDLDDFYNYIRGELADEYGLQYSEVEKNHADELDLQVLLEQHWLRNVGQSRFGERILQYPLMMQVLYYTICRLGAVLKSSAYKNLGLRYKHVSVVLEEHEGMLRPVAKFSQTDMKGKKNTGWGITTIMAQERDFIHCPVLLILAIAFRKRAFAHISSPEELFAMQVPAKDTTLTIPWKPEVLDERICDVSDSTLRKWNQEMLMDAGYKKCWRMYSIRYAMSTRLADEPEVSKDRLMQIMGHFNDTTILKSYQSRLVCIDIQGLALRKKQDKTIDFAKHLRVERGIRPPDGIPYLMQREIEGRVSESGLQGQPAYNLRQTLKKQARKRFVENWHQETHAPQSPREPSANIPDSVELLGDLSDSNVQLKVKQRLSLAHQTIMEAYNKKDFILQENVAFLRFLIELPGQGTDLYYYPDEMPVRTTTPSGTRLNCPICIDDITNVTTFWRPKHIHVCARDQLWQSYGSEPRYCYRCNIWFPFIEDYREHCRRHWDELDMFCGLVHHQQVVFISGRCPFCLPKDTLAWEERMFEFDMPNKFSSHIEDHIQRLGSKASPCPHPRCNKGVQFSARELEQHLKEAHSIVHITRSPRGRPHKQKSTPLDFEPSDFKTQIGNDGSSGGSSFCSPQHGMAPNWEIFDAPTVHKWQDPFTPSHPSREDRRTSSVAEESAANLQIQVSSMVPAELIDPLLLPQHSDFAHSSEPQPRRKVLPAANFTQTSLSSASPSIQTPTSSTVSLKASSCTTPTSADTEIQVHSPTDYTGLGTCIPFDPPNVTETLSHSDANVVGAGGETEKADTQRLKRRRLSASDGEVGKAATVISDCGDVSCSCSEQAERPVLSSANETATTLRCATESSPTNCTALPFGAELSEPEVVTPKLRSPRRQPTRATPPKTRQNARLEVAPRRSKRRRT